VLRYGEVEQVELGEPPPCEPYDEPRWHRFCRLADGGWLAIDVGHRTRMRNGRTVRPRDGVPVLVNWVCFYTDEAMRAGATAPIIAESFEEFLRRALEAGGRYYWLDPSFEPYGVVRLRAGAAS
jgi:hypothetical protein